MIVEVQGLGKRFGAVQAIDGISFSFSSSRIAGFVGPNGAGKTTTKTRACWKTSPAAAQAASTLRTIPRSFPASLPRTPSSSPAAPFWRS